VADNLHIQIAIFGVSTIALTSYLADSLMELAACHGNKPGEWLDDLESKFMQDAKSWCTEGIPSEKKLLIADGVAAFIRLATNDVRERLARGSGKNLGVMPQG